MKRIFTAILITIATLIPTSAAFASGLPHVDFNSNPAYQDNVWVGSSPLAITSCQNFLPDNGETNTDLWVVGNGNGVYIQIDAGNDCSQIKNQFFNSFTEQLSNSAPSDPPETWTNDWLASGTYKLVYGDLYNPDIAVTYDSQIGDAGIQNVETLVIHNSPRPIPPNPINTLIAQGDTVSMVATGKTLAANVTFAGDNFLLVWLGTMAASIFALRWWFIALIAISAIAYFAFRSFRFFNKT